MDKDTQKTEWLAGWQVQGHIARFQLSSESLKDAQRHLYAVLGQHAAQTTSVLRRRDILRLRAQVKSLDAPFTTTAGDLRYFIR